MRMLAIETATEACSVALFDDERVIGAAHEVLGRGHAERLVPMIANLPDRGRADRICVSLGPGSFTGVRIGIAVAKALAISWNAEVRGYPSLSLVAHQVDTAEPLVVCMNGGHGEWFVQAFDEDRAPCARFQSLAPDDAVAQFGQHLAVGNRAQEFVAHRGSGEGRFLLPEAAHLGKVPRHCLTDHVAPIYGRAPDAKLPA